MALITASRIATGFHLLFQAGQLVSVCILYDWFPFLFKTANLQFFTQKMLWLN